MHESCLPGRGARCGLTTRNWQAARGGAEAVLFGCLPGLAGRWRRGRQAHISDPVETVPQAVPPALRGAAGLLGREGVGAAEAGAQAAAAQQLGNGLPHLAAAQRVDDGVEARVEHGQGDADVGGEQQAALAGVAEEVHQQQDEERPPAEDEDPDNGDHRLQQSQGALVVPLWPQPCALVHVAVDGPVQHADRQQDDEEDDDGEEDVAFGVEREEGGARFQAADAVPAQQGEEADHQGQEPGQRHQAEDPAVAFPSGLLRQRLNHGEVALHGDQQEAENGGRQGHEEHPFPEEPERQAEVEGGAAGQADVDHVGGAGEQVAQGDVGDADVNPAPAVADARDDGHQDQKVLHNDEDAQKEEEERGSAQAGVAVGRGSVLKAAGVIVMAQDDVVETGGGRQVGRQGIHVGARGGGHEGGEDACGGLRDSHGGVLSAVGGHATWSYCGN